MRFRQRQSSSPTPEAPPRAATPEPLRPGGKRPLTRPSSSLRRFDRRSLALLMALLVCVWLVVIFGRALAEANSLTARLADEQAVNDQLRARVEAGRREIVLVQTAAFTDFEARLFGWGKPGERAFALEPGAPSPPAITPLGNESPTPPASRPLDDWLTLLFGA
jgi:cell division protein FtsB